MTLLVKEIWAGGLSEEPDQFEDSVLFMSLTAYKTIASGGQVFQISLDGEATDSLAVLNKGTLRRQITIVAGSASICVDKVFREFLDVFPDIKKVTNIEIEIIGTCDSAVSIMSGEISRQKAFVYDVALSDNLKFSKNHKRNIKKGCRNGLTCHRSSADGIYLDTHLELWLASLARRRKRQELIREFPDRKKIISLLKSGRAHLYQADIEGQIVASDLIVAWRRDAVYDSGGANSRGMELGAPHFLMAEIINDLKGRSISKLHLGVSTDDRPGLTRFKKGFGAVEHHFQQIRLDLAPVRNRLLDIGAGLLSRMT